MCYLGFVFKWLRERFGSEKVMPPVNKGPEVLLFIGVSNVIVGWAMARQRREDPVDLECLWQECPRADWLLHIALAAGVAEKKLRDAAALLLKEEKTSVSTLKSVIDSVTEHIDAKVANEPALRQLDDEELPFELGGGGGEYGLSDAEIAGKILLDNTVAELHRPFCDTIREQLTFGGLQKALQAKAGDQVAHP